MRRGGGGEAVCLRPDRNVGEARDDFAVGLLFQPRLDRLPIGKATCARERGGKDGFADAGVGAGDDETGHAAAIAAASVSAIARSEEHTSEHQSLNRNTLDVFTL